MEAAAKLKDSNLSVNSIINNSNSNSNPPTLRVLVLTHKAAGQGLNLQAASAVIHLDSDWSPAIAEQCTKRALRKLQVSKDVVSLTLRTGGGARQKSIWR